MHRVTASYAPSGREYLLPAMWGAILPAPAQLSAANTPS